MDPMTTSLTETSTTEGTSPKTGPKPTKGPPKKRLEGSDLAIKERVLSESEGKTRVCSICEQEKPLRKFLRPSRGTTGVLRYYAGTFCTACKGKKDPRRVLHLEEEPSLKTVAVGEDILRGSMEAYGKAIVDMQGWGGTAVAYIPELVSIIREYRDRIKRTFRGRRMRTVETDELYEVIPEEEYKLHLKRTFR